MRHKPAVRRPMIPDEIRYVRLLARCVFPFASEAHVFVYSLLEQANRAEPVITPKQAEALHRMLRKYRTQIAPMEAPR